eukprot:TRINITY_DN3667_c0_g1_i1.p1 TRINITY_DN3667_c0_g1~~TRINITY_DN3667_c0_g1_i1.p1  ORF type:complete len:734 (+),score=162.98 TRINITY_DN3667_c0_g1_i1:73-2274(+)
MAGEYGACAQPDGVVGLQPPQQDDICRSPLARSPGMASPFANIDKKGLVKDWAHQFIVDENEQADGQGVPRSFKASSFRGSEAAQDLLDELEDRLDATSQIAAAIAVGQDLDLTLLFLGNTLEYIADNIFGMMAAASWAQFSFVVFPVVTQWLTPMWWLAMGGIIVGASSLLILLHWLFNDVLSNSIVGSTATQRAFYCVLWMVRPQVGGLTGGACAAIELALGFSSGQAVAALLFLSIITSALAVAFTMLQFWSGCGETTQNFAVRVGQLILLTAAARATYGLWNACARGLTGSGPLSMGAPSFESGLSTYGSTDMVFTVVCALFFVHMLRRRPQDKEVDLAITDVLQFNVLFGWSMDHIYMIWELARAWTHDPAPKGLISYAALYGYLPYEFPTPVWVVWYGFALLGIAAAIALLRPDRAYIRAEGQRWWFAVWLMWVIQAVAFMGWAGYQHGMATWAQGCWAVALSVLQIGSYEPAEWVKMMALPEVEESPTGEFTLTAQQLEDILRFRYADSYIGLAGAANTLAGSFLGGPRSFLKRQPSFRKTGSAPPSFWIRRRGSTVQAPLMVQPMCPEESPGQTPMTCMQLDPVPLVACPTPCTLWEGDSRSQSRPQSAPENVSMVRLTPSPPVISLVPSMMAKAATHPDVLIPAQTVGDLIGPGPVAWTGTGFGPTSFGSYPGSSFGLRARMHRQHEQADSPEDDHQDRPGDSSNHHRHSGSDHPQTYGDEIDT